MVRGKIEIDSENLKKMKESNILPHGMKPTLGPGHWINSNWN